MRSSSGRYIVVILLWLLFPMIQNALAISQKESSWVEKSKQELAGVMAEIGVSKNDPGLLVLTNAGYAQIAGDTTEKFFDIANDMTGCSIGKRSLLSVHKSINDPMWFSLYSKSSKKLVYAAWKDGKYSHQVIIADPNNLFLPDNWKTASKGLIKDNLFSVVSLSLTWEVEPPWPLMLAATFHDHFCPGVNAGYYFGLYVQKHLPLSPEEKYVFVNAPGICPADALQMMFNTTAGKSSMYTRFVTSDGLKKYAQNGVTPASIALKVNAVADSCEGIVLGFDWDKAYKLAGMTTAEIAPPGGMSNPLFFISRVKMSRALVQMPQQDLLDLVVVLKQFSGKSSMANELSGGDPYSLLLAQ